VAKWKDLFGNTNYQYMRHQKVDADISKEWLTWGDTYALDILKDEDHALLAVVSSCD